MRELNETDAEILKIVGRKIGRQIPRWADVKPCLFGYVQKSGFVEKLGLQDQSLYQVPIEISRLTKIRYLNLAENSLSRLPEVLFDLKDLKELHLENNYFKKFPKVICEFQNLRKLYLDNNQISDLPESIKLLKSLREISLSYNNFKHVPDSIKKLKKLRQLDLRKNNLEEIPHYLFYKYRDKRRKKHLPDLDILFLDKFSSVVHRFLNLSIIKHVSKDLESFNEFYSAFKFCPICKRDNHRNYLAKFYFSKNPKKKKVKTKLIKIMKQSNKLNKNKRSKIEIGVPCCDCFQKFFNS